MPEKVRVKRTIKQARKMQFWNLLPSIPQHRTLSNLLDIYEIPQYNCYCCNQGSFDNMSLYLVTCPVLCITLVPRNKSLAYSLQKSSQQLLSFKQRSILYSNVASRMPLNLNTLLNKELSFCFNQAVNFPRRVSINIKQVNSKQTDERQCRRKKKNVWKISAESN